MADTKMKLTGRVVRLLEKKTDKNGNALNNPFIQVVMEQTTTHQVYVMADEAELPRLQTLVGKDQDIDLPVVQTLNGNYTNYRLDVPRAQK